MNDIEKEETVLDILSNNNLIKSLKKRDINVDDVDDNWINLLKIKSICRDLQPKGYIGKEEAKKMLCDFIDNWMIKCF